MQKIEDLLNKGTELLKKKDFEGASFVFQKALELDNNHVESLKSLGLCYVNLEQYDKVSDILAGFFKRRARKLRR